jgi:hypothetical protein
LSNSLNPKLLISHSKDIQWTSAHQLFSPKCIKAHHGWYMCLQLGTRILLWGNPHKQTTQGPILRKLGPCCQIANLDMDEGGRCEFNSYIIIPHHCNNKFALHMHTFTNFAWNFNTLNSSIH